MFFFSTNTICVQLISTIIRNQFDTIYNLLQRTKSTTIARHFFLRTHICFLPPPASHFTSKAGLALRFKPRAKMCSNMSTKRRRKLIKGRMRLSTYLENGVSVCREHHNVCSLQRKIAQENEKNPPSVLKSYLRFDFRSSFEFLVISILLWFVIITFQQPFFVCFCILFVLCSQQDAWFSGFSAEHAKAWAAQQLLS